VKLEKNVTERRETIAEDKIRVSGSPATSRTDPDCKKFLPKN
jgi:hypothetical protein